MSSLEHPFTFEEIKQVTFILDADKTQGQMSV